MGIFILQDIVFFCIKELRKILVIVIINLKVKKVCVWNNFKELSLFRKEIEFVLKIFIILLLYQKIWEKERKDFFRRFQGIVQIYLNVKMKFWGLIGRCEGKEMFLD